MRLIVVALVGMLLAACTTVPAAVPAVTPLPASTTTPAPALLATLPSTSLGGVPVTVRQLIENSEKFGAQRVSLTGKITVECPEGCWFFLDDGTGMIYIDLKPAELTIPQKIGSRVVLSGKIKGSGGNLQILGDEVKFLDDK